MSTFPFPDIEPNEISWTLVSNTGAFRSPLSGAIQTNDRGGERWMARLTFRNLKDSNSRRLQAFLSSLNGQQHRFTMHDWSYVKAGSVSASEMVDVPFDATNWEVSSSDGSISDIDSGIRFRVSPDGTATSLRPTNVSDGILPQTVGRTYAVSISVRAGRAAADGGDIPPVIMRIRDSSGVRFNPGGSSDTVTTSGARLIAAATAPTTSDVFLRPHMNTDDSGDYGATVDLSGLSCSRAFLVDNGFNALTKSEEFDHANWTKNDTTVSADAAVSPDGSTTADELIENSAAATFHLTTQTYTRTSTSEFWTGSVYIKENTSRRIRLAVDDGSNNGAEQFFDANTGTQTATAAVLGTGELPYASMHSVGNGWYRCRVSCRVPATTSARIRINLCDGASNTTSFTGDGSSGLYLWGAQLQLGGQVGRYTPTTTAAITGTAQTGNRIWLKGLNASADGQLLTGDQFEIAGQILRLTADLDGDAEGIGLAEVVPRVRSSLADATPVILYRPSGKFLLSDPSVSWSSRPGIFSDFSFDIIEDIAS